MIVCAEHVLGVRYSGFGDVHAADYPRKLPYPAAVVERQHLGVGPALLNLLFDKVVEIRQRGDLRLMCDAEHLTAARYLAELKTDLLGGGA